MPRSIAIQELAELLHVLGHPDRIRIVEELGSGEKDVGSLAAALEVGSSRVSQHLSVLRSHRVVAKRRDGRHVLYHLESPQLAGWLLGGFDYLQTQVPDLAASIESTRAKFEPGA